jgi:hypothetical protein
MGVASGHRIKLRLGGGDELAKVPTVPQDCNEGRPHLRAGPPL